MVTNARVAHCADIDRLHFLGCRDFLLVFYEYASTERGPELLAVARDATNLAERSSKKIIIIINAPVAVLAKQKQGGHWAL